MVSIISMTTIAPTAHITQAQERLSQLADAGIIGQHQVDRIWDNTIEVMEEGKNLNLEMVKKVITEKMHAQSTILANLSLRAVITRDRRLMQQLKEKRQKMCWEMMSNIEELKEKGECNDIEYLQLCNMAKMLF